MASFNSCRPSSSSMPTRRCTYDVFLSFRGDDTRYTFVDHLYAALHQRGLRAFKDDEELHRGKPISPELLKAIEESRFAVVVFSKNYANSSWCLEELAKIMECQALRVLPVFYHVDPSDIRGLKRDFATAFEQHQQKFGGEMDKVSKWKKALAAAANLSGWHITETGNEGESVFINKIVQEILGDAQSRGMENNLIDIDSHINALNFLLGTEATKEVRIIGIWGMGGIGKTTIAQALFKRISNMFEGHSFVKDVRENSCSKKDICALQEKILREILMARQGFMVQDPVYGAETIRERLYNKKVLLVLDDVDNVKQLEYLAATREWFGAGSRIIITTRDDHVLSNANFKYKPSILRMDQALELFSRHAFQKNSPPEGYEELSNRAIRYTGRLPLALKVIGSFFYGRPLRVWESALNRLAKTTDKDIFETLKISFDGLDESEKKILLDIACFFKGEDEEDVTRILDSFGFDPVIGINILIEKSLITISNKMIQMHDLVQEMSWQIVHENYPNSRIWKLEDVHDFIKTNKKLKAIDAIVLPYDRYSINEQACISSDVFESMKNLRLLQVDGKFTSSEPTFLPHELRWLHWEEYPFSSLPVTNNCKLVGLKIYLVNMEELWKGRKVMLHLKFIHLSCSPCLKKFPDVSGAPNIERLDLSHCSNLVEVHESVGSLKRLLYLNMEGCWKLKCLPSRFETESLETLILSDCRSLERFPEFSPCMVKLSYIDLQRCGRIKELPSSIRYLSSLSFLNLRTCECLEYIPDTICELQHLKILNLTNCTKLQKWPEKIGRMEKLQVLRLGYVDNITLKSIKPPVFKSMFSLKILDLSYTQIEVPNDFQLLTSLEELNLTGNRELIELPPSIIHLSRLKHLELYKCYRLQTLCGLPSGIQVLKAGNCISLKKIEDLSQEYEWLHKIWLFGCKKLVEDQENEIYLDKMLHKSFLQRCASVDHRLSIAISGSKIPSWFDEQQDGENIRLKLPPNWHSRIKGFALCGLFCRRLVIEDVCPWISLTFENEGELISESNVDHINASPITMDNNVVWLGYIPIKYFQPINDNWSHISVKFQKHTQIVRCGAQIVYKEDVEQFKTFSCDDYWNMEWFAQNGTHFIYQEIVRETHDRLQQ